MGNCYNKISNCSNIVEVPNSVKLLETPRLPKNKFAQSNTIQDKKKITSSPTQHLKYSSLNTNKLFQMVSEIKESIISEPIESQTKRPRSRKESSNKRLCHLRQHLPQLTDEEFSFFESVFQRNYFLKEFNDEDFVFLINSLQLYSINYGQTLYEENDIGGYFYIIKKGKFCIENKNSNDVLIFNECDSFGENEIITQLPRKGNAVCRAEGQDAHFYLLKAEDFQKCYLKANKQRIKNRISFLRKITLFKNLEKEKLKILAKQLKEVYCYKNQRICSNNSFYIIVNGIVKVNNKKGKENSKTLNIITLHSKDYFGLYNLFNSSSSLINANQEIYADVDSILIEINSDILLNALGGNYLNDISFSLFCDIAYTTHKLDLNQNILKQFYNKFLFKIYVNEETIDNKINNDTILIVIEGSLNKQTSFGESPMILENIVSSGDAFTSAYSSDFNSKIYASPYCICLEYTFANKLSLGVNDSNNLFQNLIEDCLIDENNKEKKIQKKIEILKTLEILQKLEKDQIVEISKIVDKIKFKKNEIVFEENTENDNFYFVYRGSVEIFKNNFLIKQVYKNNFFNENALINITKTQTKAIAKSSVKCLILSKKDFENLKPSTKQIISNELSLLNTDSINLNSFYFIKTLGIGKFGKVSLVHNKTNIFAIKQISKQLIEEKNILSDYILSERRILLSLNHPFIVKLIKTFKNEEFCFFLLEFISGRTIKDFINNTDSPNMYYSAQFYGACLIKVLNYLTKMKIIHRDIKSENIIIGSDGYPKLIDFGIAKKIKDYTVTIAGTPHYMAPEVIKGEGYSYSCDYWSLGVLIYEILFKRYPFGNKDNNVINVYNRIIQEDLNFSKIGNIDSVYNEDEQNCFKKLLNDLLEKDRRIRCCDFEKLKTFDFFKNLDFSKLKKKEIKSPYTPDQINNESILKNVQKNFLETLNDSKGLVFPGYYHLDQNKKIDKFDPNWADEF